VDEAGFLSVRQMLELQEFAVEHNCRLVLRATPSNIIAFSGAMLSGS
jgi:hypothetical protein